MARNHNGLIISGLAALAAIGLLAAIILYTTGPTFAADLGGNCCSDLEDRIAELEATTARKGNKAVSLAITGKIDAAYTYASLGDYSSNHIGQNGNDESYVGFSGAAKVNPDLSIGYNLEIDLRQLGLVGTTDGNPEPRVRQSYWFIKSEKLGQISMGRQAQATRDFAKWSTNDAWIGGKALSFGSLSDAYLTGIDVPFDGYYRNSVKYVSPTLAGFTLSATWSDSLDILSDDGHGNTYDVALRYRGAFGDFNVTGAAGYRRSTDIQINVLNIVDIDLPTGDQDVINFAGSIKHVPTGIFINANYARNEFSTVSFTLDGVEVQGGIEKKWIPLGHTTLAGEWGRFNLDTDYGSGELPYWGLTAVQAIDAAAMHVYAGYKHYDLGDFGLYGAPAIDAVTLGAVVQF